MIHSSRLSALVEALSGKSSPRTPDMVTLDDIGLLGAPKAIGEVLQGRRTVHVRVSGGRISEFLIGGLVDGPSEPSLVSNGSSPDPDVPELTISVDLLDALQELGIQVLDHRSGPKPGYLWEHEAARTLGITVVTLRRWALWGRLVPVHKVGRCQLYAEKDVFKFAPHLRCTVREAAQLLGCHPQNVRRNYIAGGKLRPLGGPTVDNAREIVLSLQAVLAAVGGRPALLSKPKDSRDFLQEGEDLITTGAAAQMLGLTPSQFQARYRRNNMLLPAAREPGGKQSLFRKTDIDLLLRKGL